MVYGSFGFAIKVSSVDEKYQSTQINAQSLNRFHARYRKRRKQGNLRLESFVRTHFPRKIGNDRAKTSIFSHLAPRPDRRPRVLIREGIDRNHLFLVRNSTVQLSKRRSGFRRPCGNLRRDLPVGRMQAVMKAARDRPGMIDNLLGPAKSHFLDAAQPAGLDGMSAPPQAGLPACALPAASNATTRKETRNRALSTTSSFSDTKAARSVMAMTRFMALSRPKKAAKRLTGLSKLS